MNKVIFYTREICPLCEEALSLLSLFQHEYNFELEKRDIHSNDEWLENYQLIIPVIEVNGEQLYGENINYENLDQFLSRNF